MDDNEVRALFRQAIADGDEIAMRKGIESLLGLNDGGGLSAEQEYAVRHADYVMEMPQSNERIRGGATPCARCRRRFRLRRGSFAAGPRLRPDLGHRGSTTTGASVWHVVLIWELDPEGRILRDTRYYGQRTDPPEWRSQWVEPIE